MTGRPTRIGVVGAGRATRHISLPNLRGMPGVEVVAVANARRATAEDVARDFGIPEVMDDWQALLAREDLDAIWIGTPPVLHAPVAIAALESGKHVFCQARMAMDLAEARSMLAAARRRPDLVAMLSPPPIGLKAGKFLQRLLDDGYLGELLHFRLVACDDMFADPSAPAHWRQRREVSGMNVLTVGIHAELLQRWLGAPRRVYARTAICNPVRDGYVVRVPDVVHVSGEWSDGVLGCLEWSGVALFAPEATLTLYGRDGTLEYDFATDQVRGARRGAAELSPLELPPELETHWTVEREFIAAVRSGGHPEPSFETGVRYMEFTQAVHLSAGRGREVELPLP